MNDQAYDKDAWRERTLQCLGSFDSLWTGRGRDRKLRYTYAELFGDTGEKMYRQLEPYLVHIDGRTPNYVAMEIDPTIVARAVFQADKSGKVTGRQLPYRLLFGDAYQDVPLLLNDGDEKFGMVMFDTTQGCRQSWWNRHGDVLAEVVQRASQRVPTFILGLNHTLSRGGEPGMSVIDRARLHADKLVSTFRDWNLDRAELLTPEGEEKLKHLNELIPSPFKAGKLAKEQYALIDGFDIYRSANKVLDMITVRIAFDSRRHRASVWVPDSRAVP
jgi:hypothetical protein